MKLLTKPLIRKFPRWGSTKGKDMADIKVICKFRLPGTFHEWYVIEYDGIDEFLGLIKDEEETRLDYFTLEQLYQKKGPMGIKVIRDKWFSSCKLSELIDNKLKVR